MLVWRGSEGATGRAEEHAGSNISVAVGGATWDVECTQPNYPDGNKGFINRHGADGLARRAVAADGATPKGPAPGTSDDCTAVLYSCTPRPEPIHM
eukprot:918133-Prymnesium_polylepis.1